MSSAVDEDTVRAVNAGRETLGAMLRSAQKPLQKVFIVFLLGFVGTFYALRIYIWDFLEATAKAEMDLTTAAATDVITRTPFEVILLQAKIGLLVGIIVAIPALLYFSRDALRRRGVSSVVPISKRYQAGFALTSATLFVAGVAYAYAIFFPYAFNFLGVVSVDAGVKPSFGITEFTEFIALLTLSFGLAAQLPLFMSVLAYTEIVPYETFRDKWRYAVVGITVFGALFSPPDPFTLLMWAAPLVILYVFSLGLAKLVTNIRRRGAAKGYGSGTALMKRRVLQFAGTMLAGFLAVLAAIGLGAFEWIGREIYPRFPEGYRPTGESTIEVLAAEGGLLGQIGAALIVAVAVGFLALLAYTIKVLQSPVYPPEAVLRSADLEDVDFEVLDADDVPELSARVFLEMEEDQALEIAREAMYDDDREKAEAILDRFDTLNAEAEEAEEGEVPEEARAAADAEGAEEEGGLLQSTAAGVVDSFTEEETTEEDIGGYAYDIAFILNSLTSKMFRLVALFMIVLAGTFFLLYQGALKDVLLLFLDRVPEEVLHEVAVRNDADPVGMTLEMLIDEMGLLIALHPVEVLIFIVKVSFIAAVVAVLPLLLYYSWPAARERGLVRGDPRVFLVWGGALALGFAAGTYIGFFWIAPAVISYLVADAINAQMVVSYRMNSFFWLVIYTTVGVGFLFNIIVTMALFHVGGIASYRSMRRAWRGIVLLVFFLAALFSARGVLTMLVVAFPIGFTYVLGLAVLHVFTLGGRLFGGGGGGDIDPELTAD